MWKPTPLEEKRVAKLNELAELGIDAYPYRSIRTHLASDAIDAYEHLEELGQEIDLAATVCGRLVSVRNMGKTIFAHIEDGSGRIQLFIRREEIGEESQIVFRKLVDLGDFIQASGYLFRTRMGEVSLHVKEWVLLSKALSPLPVVKEQVVDNEVVRYGAFSDKEDRYRQRYADLAVNPEVRQVFVARARVISALRQFFDDNGFLEVETPVMQPLYGGAAARPFKTYHNQLKQELFLRISFELKSFYMQGISWNALRKRRNITRVLSDKRWLDQAWLNIVAKKSIDKLSPA